MKFGVNKDLSQVTKKSADQDEKPETGPAQDEQEETDPNVAEYEREKQAALEKQKETSSSLDFEGVKQKLGEIEEIQRDYTSHLESKHITQEQMVTLFQKDDFYDPNKSQRRNCENFVLKPDPILTLDRIMGV